MRRTDEIDGFSAFPTLESTLVFWSINVNEELYCFREDQAAEFCHAFHSRAASSGVAPCHSIAFEIHCTTPRPALPAPQTTNLRHEKEEVTARSCMSKPNPFRFERASLSRLAQQSSAEQAREPTNEHDMCLRRGGRTSQLTRGSGACPKLLLFVIH